MKLSIKAFGLASGIFWGVSLFLWALFLSLTSVEWSRAIMQSMVGMYPYFDMTVQGAFAGLVFGFLDGLICGSIFAWLYNRFAGKK